MKRSQKGCFMLKYLTNEDNEVIILILRYL